MDFIDGLLHVANFFAPALGVGALGALLAKLVWRRELRVVPWRRLAAWGCGAGALASFGGLVVLGRDGRIATYAAVVLAAAVALWWAGFRHGR
jgi:hypothetical protein